MPLSTLLLFFTAFFIMTRRTIVRVVNYDKLQVEIHMPIFAVVILPGRRSEGRREGSKKSKTDKQATLDTVRRIIKNGNIEINDLRIPVSAADSPIGTVAYRILYSTTLSYLESISRGLTIKDNAIILSPDAKKLQYDVSINSRLYDIAYALFRLLYHKMREKINVRE